MKKCQWRTVFLFILPSLVFVACQSSGQNDVLTVAAPAFSPPAGTYGTAQNVAISTTTAGATIRYTTDGTMPSATSGTAYSGPVSVAETLTIKAVAYKSGWNTSPVSSALYTIEPITVSAPTFSPPAGTYGTAQNVTISTTTVGATIRYTTDGTTPSETSGTVYAAPVIVNETLTIKAVAFRTGWITSPVSSAPYMIGPPQHVFAYVANEGSNTVSAYGVDLATGAWTQVAGSPFAGGQYPWHVAVHAAGNFVFVTNEISGDISAYTADAETGALTEIPGSPFAAGTWPRCLSVDPSGKFAYVTNFLSNNISAYTIEPTTGALTAIAGSPFAAGISPHSMAFDVAGKFAYVPNEESNTISAYAIDSVTGALTEITGSPFAAAPFSWSIAVDPAGKFAFVANWTTPGSVSAYRLDATTGALAEVPGSPFAAGDLPFAVTVDPAGKFVYVANENSDTVSAYSIEPATGVLTEIAGSPFTVVGRPECFAIDPTGKFAYVASYNPSAISAFSIDPTTGVPTELAGWPMVQPAGTHPISIAICRLTH